MIDKRALKFHHGGRPLGWFWVITYPDHESMIKAHLRSNTLGHEPDAWAVFEMMIDFPRPNLYVGLMRVVIDTAREHVIHEAIHATTALRRNRYGARTDLGDTTSYRGDYDSDPEEIYAFMAGAVIDAVLRHYESLSEFKGWPTVE